MKLANGLELRVHRIDGYGGPGYTEVTAWLGKRCVRRAKASEFEAGIQHERMRAEFEPLSAADVAKRFEETIE